MPFIARENSWTTLYGQAIALNEVTQYWPTNTKLKSNDTLTTPQDSYESYVAKSVEALNQESLKKIVAARKVRVQRCLSLSQDIPKLFASNIRMPTFLRGGTAILAGWVHHPNCC